MDQSKKPDDPGLSSAYRKTVPPHSVLTRIEERTGQAPRITLREGDEGSAGSPLIDPSSVEKLSLPDGRGSYQLMGEIARGGMGVIIKGHDTDLGRDVALKILGKDLADRPEIVQRFVEEAQIGGQLQHPGIVPVYELGLMADERPYFSMKLVKGRTLATLLAERESGTTERARLLEVFVSICQTVGYAHSRGVIHRDLKPANIMVGAFGEVQVVDWGLAKVLTRSGKSNEERAQEEHTVHTVLETVRSSGSGSSTGTDSVVGSVMGTPSYMPPEQAAGYVDRLDERSDVFALGAILCEILTGAPPYTGEGEHPLVQAAHAKLEPALERLAGCGADPELVELTKQCLLPAPALRPRNGGVVAERIRQHLASLEERAQSARVEAAEARVRAEEADVHAQQERHARKLTLGLAAAVLGLFALGGGGWLWVTNDRAAREREEIAREREAARRERDLVARVNASLNEVASLRGAESWDEAFAAVDRAAAVADAGQAGPEAQASIAAARASLQAAFDAAAARAEHERAADRFLSELEEVNLEGEMQLGPEMMEATDEAFRSAFLAHGVDVDGMPSDEVARSLGSLGVASEVVPFLDSWLVARRFLQNLNPKEERDLSGCIRLVDVMHRLDDDPVRADLREALINEDMEMIKQLAQSDLSEQPLSTIILLGTALQIDGESEEALRILRQAGWRHYTDYNLAIALVRTLLIDLPLAEAKSSDQLSETIMYARAALSLRPENLGLLDLVLTLSVFEGLHAELQGKDEIAVQRYRRATSSLDDVPLNDLERSWIGLAYFRGGETQAGAARLGQVAEAAIIAVMDEGQAFEARYFIEGSNPMLIRAGELELVERCSTRLFEVDQSARFAYEDLWFARALQRVREGSADEVVQALQTAVERNSNRPEAVMNNLAWRSVRWPRRTLHAACMRAGSGDPERIDRNLEVLLDEALRMSEISAVALDGSSEWNTLAWARYRAGDLEGSLEALERSMRSGGTHSDLYLLAIVQHERGNDVEAFQSFEEANRSVARMSWFNIARVDEAVALRAEARAALGVDPDDR